MVNKVKSVLTAACLWFMMLSATTLLAAFFPENPRDIRETTSYDSMVEILESVKGNPMITITEEGESVEGRKLFLVRFAREDDNDPWKIFFVGTQHGNEPAGKDALLYMIEQIHADPSLLPPNTELYILPLANPDGAEADERRNANDADLNRDHMTLLEPETAILHELQQRIMAHVAVDCHEYTRDSGRYADAGAMRWPLIMLGAVNHPLVDQDIRSAASTWVDGAERLFEEKGINFGEYYVGGPPPEELRLSTPDPDDLRNGLGLYNTLSFIIESGVNRGAEDPDANLGERVEAYYILLSFLMDQRDARPQLREVIEKARNSSTPEFLPTNFFWANATNTITEYPMLDLATGRKRIVRTANFMHDLVVKNYVTTPDGYIIEAAHADLFATLLDRHGIPYETIEEAKPMRFQQAKLLRLEEEYDPVYNRYDGRQIVELQDVREGTIPPGSIYVKVEGLEGLRACAILEPAMLYGLYQFAPFKGTASAEGILPVARTLPWKR